MNDVSVLVQRDCLGGDRIVELKLPRAVALPDLDRVDGVVTRVVLSELPRPFFKLDVPGRFLLTGIIGDPRIRVTVRLSVRDRAVPTAIDVARSLLAGP